MPRHLYAYCADAFPEYLHGGIVDVLLEYGHDYAPDWKRARDSLLTEWDSHCLFAAFSKRAMNVDFNNKEEGKGYSYFVGKAIKAVIS